MTQTWRGYEGSDALTLAERYDALDPAQIHGWLLPMLPERPSTILDVGAGSGRDAAWLASMGHDVVAVEPAPAMLAEAQRRHPCPQIRWVCDSLPALAQTYRLGVTFDVILLSAVWMHVAPQDRSRAFRKLVTLLRPGGVLAITLRHGTPDPDRCMYPVSATEIGALAKAHTAAVIHEDVAEDRLGRGDVHWSHMALRLADDGTGALPLLRHFILMDSKSATYKLALLRTIARAADSAQGMAEVEDDTTISIPLGLIGLIWLRLYKPLIDADLPQTPSNRGMDGLGFIKVGWRSIADLAPLDLRVGAVFNGPIADGLHNALRDAVATITRMPAHYLTFPGRDEQVLKAFQRRVGPIPDPLVLNAPYLQSFGVLHVPMHLWRALTMYDVWIEPALVAEWGRLMHSYAHRQGRELDPSAVGRAMAWSDPARDVGLARKRALRLMGRDALFCVWTGARLSERTLDIDHCMPWSAWPCEDLWNLMPSHRKVNQHQKRQRLPSAGALVSARDRIMAWWDAGYVAEHGKDYAGGLGGRFFTEAAASLPIQSANLDLDAVFDGAATRRVILRATQQVEEWTPARG